MLGPDALIGLSITDAAQLEATDLSEADYLGVGAVFQTGSKADAQHTGLQLLATARSAVDLPDRRHRRDHAWRMRRGAVRAGADVLAVISAIAAAPDPGSAARRLLEVVRAAQGRSPGSPGART